MKPISRWFTKSKTVMFGLAMTFASFAQAHAQAISQDDVDSYIYEANRLHQGQTNAITADEQFMKVSNDIRQKLRNQTCEDLAKGDINQAAVHAALLQKLAEAVLDEKVADAARKTYDFLETCSDQEILYEELPAQEAAQYLLEMSEKELRAYLSLEFDPKPTTILEIRFGNTVVKYQEANGAGVASANTTGGHKVDDIPEGYLKREISKVFADTTKQNKILYLIQEALRGIE